MDSSGYYHYNLSTSLDLRLPASSLPSSLASSSLYSPPPGTKTNTGRMFSCNFCQKTFCSSQALGGHQNAHKLERSTLPRKTNKQSLCSKAYVPNYSIEIREDVCHLDLSLRL